ncbi:hypothetical protein [Hydrocarboniphaga sp.]|uniref:Ig-like domain-containing protein n=1 Tax=Hydrocarboniphaga sp. TaxID=2033016 RepID=UPI0026053A7F|nr:hypothetical protein [Hydrocarboniphaga sp.]
MMLCDGRSAMRSLVLLPVSAILLLSACASPDDNGDPTQVSDLTGTITGVIQDTRGHGIAGATIRYAGASEDGTPLSVTSGSDGSFSMPGVIVSGVSSIASNDVNGPITLVVASPSGDTTYLGATVSAMPTAQSGSSVGGGTVFVDGFNVGVGIVKLPQLASSVSGVLRSTSTGTAVSGAHLALNFIGVEPLTTATTAGVATSYDAASMSATSDSSGSFNFPTAYNDSCLQFVVSSYKIDSVTGSAPPCPIGGLASDTNTINLRTSDASSPVLLANVSVSPPTSSDTVAPFVASVDGVIDPSASPAQLESSVTKTFTIHFSEPLEQGLLDPADVSVILGVSPNQTYAVVSAVTLADNTVTIILGSAVPASTAVTLHIAREALKDTAGNGIADASGLAYDSLTSQELVLSFVSFGSSNTVASAAATAQVSTQAIADDLAYISTDALLDTVDTASDIRAARTPAGTTTAYGTAPEVEQVNSTAAVTALNALLLAVAPSDTRTVQPGLARVTVVAPANGSAADYVVWLERAGNKLDALFFPVQTSGGNPQNTSFISNNGSTYVISPGGAAQFDLLIRARVSTFTVQAGDVFHITSRNTSGVSGGSSQATLADNGRPTVALQLLDELIAGTTSSGSSGGVVTPVSPSEPATVLLSITPQAADVNDSNTDYADDNWRGASELQGLSSAALKSSTFATDLNNGSGTRAIGDAEGTAAFIKTSTTLGIAITEPGTATGTVPTTSNMTATLSAPLVLNNVTSAEDGSVSNLFSITVSNIFQFANDASAGTAEINLGASIKDLNGVSPDAGTRALVRLRDLMPPLVKLGFYDGANFTFVFNEPISQLGSLLFSGCNAQVALTATGVVLSADGTVITFPGTLVNAGAVDACFDETTTDVPPYEETAYTAANLGALYTAGGTPNSANPPHGVVSYLNVPDKAVDPSNPTAAGNTWTAWTNLSPSLGIGAPYFAVANITPVTTP